MNKEVINQDLIAYQKKNSKKIKERLIKELHPLVAIISKKFTYLGENYNDLQQIGSLGLLKAIDHFDQKNHTRFFAYLSKKIIGEIKHHFRDHFKLIKIPRKYLKIYHDVNVFIQRYLQKNKGKSPTIAQIANGTHYAEELILETIEVMNTCSTVNVERPTFKRLGQSSASANNYDYTDTLYRKEDQYFEDKIDNQVFLDKIMQPLSFRERKILQMHFGNRLTQHEIALRFKTSQVNIYRIINRALSRCRLSAKELGRLYTSRSL